VIFNLAEEEVDGLQLFIPEPSEIFWSFVVILILGVAFYKFFLPKITDILEQRSEKIEGELANAATQKIEAQKLFDEYKAQIKDAKLEVATIKEDARVQATQILEEAHIKAAQDAELFVRNARRAIESERKNAEVELKKQTSSLAMTIVQRMLTNGVDNSERQSKLIDRSIDEFERTLSPQSARSSAREANPKQPRRRDSDSTRRRRIHS
jgi:F-type H+-transporting ATPase subunit b